MSTKIDILKANIRKGQVFRRKQVAQWSTAIDRHLKQLCEEGYIQKLSGGLYYRPEQSEFGSVPPELKAMVRAFLNDSRFLIKTGSAYNSLGLGTTQLYNEVTVYNRKRHGRFELGGLSINFQVKPYFPQKLSTEFLLVDLVDTVDSLAEDGEAVLARVKKLATSEIREQLLRCAHSYGSERCKNFFNKFAS
jgi:hypothetical protein